jgi:hypothetical protein
VNNPSLPVPCFLLVGAACLLALAARAAEPALLDDFTDAALTGRGASRFVVDDKGMGSQSHATQRCENGLLIVEGELVPGRGLPSFISVPLLLAADAQPRDLSAYEGVRLRVKLTKGALSVQVSTADIQNFDFHGAPVVGAKRGEFVEVRVPFKAMKRAWSEQTAINLKVATSVNLVAFSLARDTFSYEIDEIGFY